MFRFSYRHPLSLPISFTSSLPSHASTWFQFILLIWTSNLYFFFSFSIGPRDIPNAPGGGGAPGTPGTGGAPSSDTCQCKNAHENGPNKNTLQKEIVWYSNNVACIASGWGRTPLTTDGEKLDNTVLSNEHTRRKIMDSTG